MDTLNQLIETWRADADRFRSYGADRLATACERHAEQLEEALSSTEGVEPGDRRLSTEEVAERFAVEPATVADWCRQGRFPSATKTSGDSGNWRIPLGDVREGPNCQKVEGEDRVTLSVE